MSRDEKVELFDNLMRVGGAKALRALRILALPSLDAVLLETTLLTDCQDGLRQHVNAQGWLRYSLAAVSSLGDGLFEAVGALWSSLEEELRRGFTVAVWVTTAVGVEGERELAVHLASYSRHKAAACNMGVSTDYCLCHYADRQGWHRVEARYDVDSRLIQVSLAGWKKLKRVRRHPGADRCGV